MVPVAEIVPEVPYTEEDLAYYTNGRADQEQNDPSSRPALSGSVQNMEEYDMIVIGYAGTGRPRALSAPFWKAMIFPERQ